MGSTFTIGMRAEVQPVFNLVTAERAGNYISAEAFANAPWQLRFGDRRVWLHGSAFSGRLRFLMNDDEIATLDAGGRIDLTIEALADA